MIMAANRIINIGRLVLFLLIAPSAALACACCSDQGSRKVGSARLDDEKLRVLERLSFHPKVSLYNPSGGNPKGIASVEDPFTLQVSKKGKTWTFDLQDQKGAKGKLHLTLPANIDVFEVDPRDVDVSEPPLYKEWRITSTFKGDGFFQGATEPTRLTLILHGKGNYCDNADDFHHWTIVGLGRNTSFSLLGGITVAKE